MNLVNSRGKKVKLKPGHIACLCRDEAGKGKDKAVVWSIILCEKPGLVLRFLTYEGKSPDRKLSFPEFCFNQAQGVMEHLFIIWATSIACATGLNVNWATMTKNEYVVASAQFTK